MQTSTSEQIRVPSPRIAPPGVGQDSDAELHLWHHASRAQSPDVNDRDQRDPHGVDHFTMADHADHLNQPRYSDHPGRGARVAAVALNVKASDLLFVDHLDASLLSADDRAMWASAGLDLTDLEQLPRPFDRVRFLVPLAPNGVHHHTLRSSLAADVPGYSSTAAYTLGIGDLWPQLDLLWDEPSAPAAQLRAAVLRTLEQRTPAAPNSTTPSSSGSATAPLSLAAVLAFFESDLLAAATRRTHAVFAAFHDATIRATYQRLASLEMTLGGLVDLFGPGFGLLPALDDLQPFDLVVIDLERVMAATSDPGLADLALKLVVGVVLRRLTSAMTHRHLPLDHFLVFIDELGTLAPPESALGIGAQLAEVLRTTRDRGLTVIGAGQFRSGMRADVVRAPAVQVTMQTPITELQEPFFAPLTPEMRTRLALLPAGQMLLQFPGMASPVFARFPRPFVFTGAQGLATFPEAEQPSFGEAIAARLASCDLQGRRSSATRDAQVPLPILPTLAVGFSVTDTDARQLSHPLPSDTSGQVQDAEQRRAWEELDALATVVDGLVEAATGQARAETERNLLALLRAVELDAAARTQPSVQPHAASGSSGSSDSSDSSDSSGNIPAADAARTSTARRAAQSPPLTGGQAGLPTSPFSSAPTMPPTESTLEAALPTQTPARTHFLERLYAWLDANGSRTPVEEGVEHGNSSTVPARTTDAAGAAMGSSRRVRRGGTATGAATYGRQRPSPFSLFEETAHSVRHSQHPDIEHDDQNVQPTQQDQRVGQEGES